MTYRIEIIAPNDDVVHTEYATTLAEAYDAADDLRLCTLEGNLVVMTEVEE